MGHMYSDAQFARESVPLTLLLHLKIAGQAGNDEFGKPLMTKTSCPTHLPSYPTYQYNARHFDVMPDLIGHLITRQLRRHPFGGCLFFVF